MTAARVSLTNPAEKAKAWRAYTKDLAKLHMDRRHPERSMHVNDDPGNSCDMLLALDTQDGVH
jgi:hypothetical protein